MATQTIPSYKGVNKKHRNKSAVVYLATNLVNGKRYVGITSQRLSARVNSHFSEAKRGHTHMPILRAIQKHGRENFKFEVLLHCTTFEDACRQEIRLIADLKPEYNATRGGEGTLGIRMSSESRRMISERMKGKPGWMLGRKPSPEMRELLLANHKRTAHLWPSFAHLGPKAVSKRVICLDDSKTYESASAAARAYDVAKSAVIELCLEKRYRKTLDGLRFAYVKEESHASPRKIDGQSGSARALCDL